MEIRNQNASFSKLRIIKNLTAISISFLLMFTACDGLIMLQTTMNKEEGIGTVGQAAMFIAYGISSLLLSSYVSKKLGSKSTQLLGMIMYLPYVAANFYPSWITLLPSAVIIGVGCTLLWGAQCTYFNECSVLYRDITDDSTDYIPSPVITYRSGKGEIKELSAKDFLQEAERSLNSHGDCENSLKTSPSFHLPSYKRSEPGNETESNRQCSERTSKKTTEYVQDFENLNSETINNHKLSEDIQAIEGKKNKPFALHTKTKMENNHNQKSKFLSSVNSLFFGFHGLAYCSAQVWSNLISFYVLASEHTENYHKTSNCSCGADFCNTDQECVNSKIEEVPSDIRQYYTGLCFACGILAVLLIWLFVDLLEKSKKQVTLSWNHIFATVKFIRNKEQLFIIPLTICTSMVQAFYMADFMKSYIACSWSTSHIGLVSVFYGITSALSSMISGVLIRLIGRRIVLICCQIINIVSLVLLYLWTPDAQQAIMFYLAGGIFGFVIGIFHPQTKALYGVFFQGEEETAYSSCNMYSSIGWALPFVYNEFFCTSIKLYIMFTISCLGLLGYLLAERSFSRRKKQNETFK
ncbi:protein unc-93 homolog A-like [Argiope bruennichi]|uniref:protein unc-93 homolog A-like n=1 Tax=Argiope bruennichi TaxID=94029 RepID=UPI00249591CE|nr:protein unc-93 homolog A-like [Argiope bruennichi]XP_055947326.1 protein unc-93 homolog A-like [Argiope bruennichi]XP_055947328.1 protein unc-93 homolog A-like [Argiope bruennichi]